jgi:Holliday junction resolvasome RuvABC endonuclease subunit
VITVLGLDPSLSTGWAMGSTDPQAPFRYGVKRLPNHGKSLGPTLDALISFLDGLLADYTPELVIYESPWLPAGGADVPMLRRLFSLHGAIEWVAHRRGISCYEVTPSEWRQSFFGPHFHGKMRRAAAKDLAIEQAKRRGWRPETDDVADALGVMDHALQKRSAAYASWSLTCAMRAVTA